MAVDVQIRVVLVDPDDISRSGCQAIFAGDERFSLIGETANIARLQRRDLDEDVDVIVYSPHTEGGSGEQKIAGISRDFPDASILLLTESTEVSVYVEALGAGARGLLLKGQTPAWLLLSATELLARSSTTIIDCNILFRMDLAGMRWRSPKKEVALSPRESEVAKLLGKGLSDDEVGRSLGIARATVHTHVSSVMRKVQAANRVQLGIYLAETGLVDSGCLPDT